MKHDIRIHLLTTGAILLVSFLVWVSITYNTKPFIEFIFTYVVLPAICIAMMIAMYILLYHIIQNLYNTLKDKYK